MGSPVIREVMTRKERLLWNQVVGEPARRRRGLAISLVLFVLLLAAGLLVRGGGW